MDGWPRSTMTEQQLRCSYGGHQWGDWGAFMPVRPEFTIAPIDDNPPKLWSVEAYRWRLCDCGAGERETYATHERCVFGRDEMGS